MTADLEMACRAFEEVLRLDPKDGLTVKAEVQGEELRVEVRHQDVDELRGFDVMARAAGNDQKTAEAIGREMAQVVERELGYGQLPACGDDGHYKHIMV